MATVCRRAGRTTPAVPPTRTGKFNPRTGAETVVAAVKRELPNAVYRWDPAGKLEVVVPETELADPERYLFRARL